MTHLNACKQSATGCLANSEAVGWCGLTVILGVFLVKGSNHIVFPGRLQEDWSGIIALQHNLAEGVSRSEVLNEDSAEHRMTRDDLLPCIH